MNQTLPTLFVSHGAPDIVLRDISATRAMRELGELFVEPKGIVIVSAHWIDEPIGITGDAELETIHDFGGFSRELYSMRYPAKGDTQLTSRVGALLQQRGITSRAVSGRGLDHGAWLPLKLIYPEANIRVVQLSLPAGSLTDLARMGEALAPLREEGVLIIGSGGTVHNLRAVNPEGQTEAWAEEFEQWLYQAVTENHFDWLTSGRDFPESFRMAHPTVEHYAPLVFAWAAADGSQPGRRFHHSFDYGNIGMSIYLFGEALEKSR